ncbi:MAG: DNA recombination/repair protein RecA, partial [Bacteroidota bacterium]
VEMNIIKKAGSWFSYGDTKLGQGRDAVKQLLHDNPELCDEIENKIREALAAN